MGREMNSEAVPWGVAIGALDSEGATRAAEGLPRTWEPPRPAPCRARPP